MSIYNMRNSPGGYAIHKMDDDYNFLESYDLRWEGDRLQCSCPAGIRPTCRHRQMAWLFSNEKKLDTGWFYDFDKKEWLKPLLTIFDEASSVPDEAWNSVGEEPGPSTLAVDQSSSPSEVAVASPQPLKKPSWRRL